MITTSPSGWPELYRSLDRIDNLDREFDQSVLQVKFFSATHPVRLGF